MWYPEIKIGEDIDWMEVKKFILLHVSTSD